jgi:hypothetical protein
LPAIIVGGWLWICHNSTVTLEALGYLRFDLGDHHRFGDRSAVRGDGSVEAACPLETVGAIEAANVE